ncbi:dihydrofolate reductase family protein [Cohnella thailandensis]|uniref:Dihydrofolate reductase family protein n=1 Tax=Cohnella thailandensis TaxID=557557 RepID=A0A841SZM6_9BACL|nr:dihydrofolate reductase family protein [Cohnella thailandensis]MBB6634241.1 dihydrofolate reductase family protein [Cohnella thailandensis]MBP1972261.1 dihydrofolate reductase [Cohnella thailandensis]
MKTILWATLTANGNYAQSGPDNPPTQEALSDFAEQAKAAGNFIVGRKTFEGMQDPSRVSLEEQTNAEGPFAGMDIVVMSKSIQAIPGLTIAGSPREALDCLRQKGHKTALVSGGADIHNSFLGEGLVDELIFNVAPVVEGKGLNLLIDKDNYRYKKVKLLDCKPLGGGIVQLRYGIDR